jgi:hypothetical protein
MHSVFESVGSALYRRPTFSLVLIQLWVTAPLRPL